MGCTPSSNQSIDIQVNNPKKLAQFQIQNNLNNTQQSELKQKTPNIFSNNQNSSVINKIHLRQFLFKLKQKYVNEKKYNSEQTSQLSIDHLKQEIRDIMKGIVKQKLFQTNQNKITMKQCKIQIAQQILKIQIQIMKYTVHNFNSQEKNSILDQMDNFLKILSGFLKTKYPRSQSLQAGQLSKMFKQFDATEEFDYDMLKNSGFSFSSSNQLDIFKTIKLFLNKIIDELQMNYPKFQVLIREIDGHFKIGRKISENTAKYSILDAGTLNVKSTQIVRVLIKWVQQLWNFINNSQKKINYSSNQYKFSKYSEKEDHYIFQKLDQSQLPQKMQQKLTQIIQVSNEKITQRLKQIQNYFKQFNLNLFKTFNQVQKFQIEVQSSQAQIIKYSYFNYDYISWMIQEKLLILIKTFVQIGQNFPTKYGNLDLIKFKVNDIMRCQYLGNRKQIMSIFQKFKQLQIQGKIQIVKIKNRFHTFLGDAMIFFKLKESFLICECQLVLYQQNQTQDLKKSKNIETMNHFLYQLERSPFGVMGQCSAFLRTKCQTVSSYCQKIKMKLKSKSQIQNCKKFHYKMSTIQQNKRPFLCSECLKYNKKCSNIKKIHQCKECSIFICNNCMNQNFQITQEMIKTSMINSYKSFYCERQKFIINYYSEQQFLVKIQQGNFFSNMFSQQKNKLYDIFKTQKIKIESIMNYFKIIQEQKILIEKSNKDKQRFVILTWKQSSIKFKCYEIDYQKGNIYNMFQPLEKYEKHQNMLINKFDLLYKFKRQNYNDFQEQTINQENIKQFKCLQILEDGFYIFDGESKPKMKRLFQKTDDKQKEKCVLISSPLIDDYSFKIDFIIGIYRSNKRSKQDGWLKKYFEELPDLNQFRKNIKLPLQKIVNEDLAFLKNLEWRLSIKTLNLRKNQIKNVNIIFQTCKNIEKIDLYSNQIEQICFFQDLLFLKELNMEINKIRKVQNLKYILSIEDLNLRNNQIESIFIQKYPEQIKQTINNVKQKQKDKKQTKDKKQVNILATSNIVVENKKKQEQSVFVYNKLKRFDISNNKLIDIDFMKNMICPQLIEFELIKNQITHIPQINTPNITLIDLSLNCIENIIQFGKSLCFSNLLSLTLNKLKCDHFPPLGSALQFFKYQNSNLTDQQLNQILNKSDLSQLIELSLTKNNLKSIPPLSKYTSLKKLYLQENPIQENLQNIRLSQLQNLQKLWISFKCSSNKQFNDLKFKVSQSIKDSNSNFVCWYYREDDTTYQSQRKIQKQQILLKRHYLLSLLKSEETINSSYIMNHQSGLYALKICFRNLNLNDFTKYDWRQLQAIQLISCGINDQFWRILCRNNSMFPNLKYIQLDSNCIRYIGLADLDGFKCIRLRTFKKVSLLKNLLMNDSKNSLKKLKQTHPQIQVLY